MSNHHDKTNLSPPIKTNIHLSTIEGNSTTTPRSVTDMFMGTQTPPLAGEQATVQTNEFLGCCSATCSTPSHVTVPSKGLAPSCSPLSPVNAMDTVDNTQSVGNQAQTSKSATSKGTKAKREKVPKKAKTNTKRKLKKPPPSLPPVKEYGLGNRFPSDGSDEQVLGVIPCIDFLHEIPDLSSHDVVLGASTGLLPLAGSEFLRRLVRQRQERYSRGTPPDRDAISSFLCDVVTGLSPPGRFIVRNKDASEWQILGLESAKTVIHELFNHGFCTSTGKSGYPVVAALPPLQNVEAPKFHHLLQAAAIEGANDPLTGFPARLMMMKPYECSRTGDSIRDTQGKESAVVPAQQTPLKPIDDMHIERNNIEPSSTTNVPSSQQSQHCRKGMFAGPDHSHTDIIW
eukprot:Nitzschia sp. Nitz4//scaffold3_size479765//5135//6468//NITZ4_000003-RA/size479765-augustus-gene-0.18-mRNA-1//-1//CDS//3329550467//2025//frame0